MTCSVAISIKGMQGVPCSTGIGRDTPFSDPSLSLGMTPHKGNFQTDKGKGNDQEAVDGRRPAKRVNFGFYPARKAARLAGFAPPPRSRIVS